MFLTVLHFFSPFFPKSESLRLLLQKSDHERDSLLSLFTKEQWEQFALFYELIAISLTKKERFAWKTKERIPNPAVNCLERKKNI